jgi:ribosomal protein S18 acetylase RimI-like enzyme
MYTFELNIHMIQYQIENDLSVDEFKEVLINSTLGERRPVNDMATLSKMLEHGNLIITARVNEKLVGIARSLTDFLYCTYLSDLAVDENYQRMGIGKELIRRTKLASPNAKLILLAAPKAVTYYPKIGMTQFEQCYILNNLEDLK